MITLITGAPGAGKTAALVSLLQETLAISGRQIYVHGIPDLKIPHEELKDPDSWPDTVPDGSVIIIDEVQTVWRPRGPGQKPPEHITKLETHRHRGLDFYIITQGPNLVDTNVRALVGRHVHLRDIGFLGRWWYEWPETADNCRIGWKNAPIKKKYKLPVKIFDQYKSSSLHVKPIRSFPKMFVVAVLALVSVLVLAYFAYGRVSAKIHPVQPVVSAVTSGQAGSLGQRAGPARLGPIDELKDLAPRVPGRPWTAPAYDEIRKVVSMPLITGAICIGDNCKCYHNNLIIHEVTNLICAAWAAEPYFNPYQSEPQPESAPMRSEPVQVARSSS